MVAKIIEVLSEPAVAGALAAVVIVLAKAAIKWIESKTPEGIVDTWWPYLHDAIVVGLEWIGDRAESGKLTRGDADNAIAIAVAEFKKEMSLHEPGQKVTPRIEAAARAEIVQTYNRYMEGVLTK